MENIESITIYLDDHWRSEWWMKKTDRNPDLEWEWETLPSEVDIDVHFNYQPAEKSTGIPEEIEITAISHKDIGQIPSHRLPAWLLEDAEHFLWKKIKGGRPC